MKHYYDIINNSVFSIDNFEYTPRDNQDYEITEEELNNYFDKLRNFYDVAVEVIEGKVKFTYTKNETSEGYLLNQIELYKQELLSTDYIITKIAEAQALGEDTTELLNKYSEIISNRKLIRIKINELEEKLNKEDKWRTILN